MGDASLLRLLEVVCRKLDALDARVEIGGRPPTDPRCVWVDLSPHRRLVAELAVPVDDPEPHRRRLAALVGAFGGATRPGQSSLRPSSAEVAGLLDEALGALVGRSAGMQAVVIDVASPVLWGTSHPEPVIDADEDFVRPRAELAVRVGNAGDDLAAWLAERAEGTPPPALREREPTPTAPARPGHVALVEPPPPVSWEELRGWQRQHPTATAATWRRALLTVRAIAAVRAELRATAVKKRAWRQLVQQDDFGYLARSFADIYVLLVVFGQRFSELRVRGAVGRLLPRVERLVLSLPPIQPPPRGGRIVELLP